MEIGKDEGSPLLGDGGYLKKGGREKRGRGLESWIEDEMDNTGVEFGGETVELEWLKGHQQCELFLKPTKATLKRYCHLGAVSCGMIAIAR